MSKKKYKEETRKRKKSHSQITPNVSEAANSGDDEHNSESTLNTSPTSIGWSKSKQRIVSGLILGYLFLLLVGPMSNPVASPYLSGPIAEAVSPFHRAFFLGHGYRFFGPDPGPSHILVFRGKKNDGEQFEGQFPDRDQHWPRLLYHRWFMLSETIFAENFALPSQQQFDQRLEGYESQIAQCQRQGQLELASELQSERDIESEQYSLSRKRVETLGTAVAKELMRENDGSEIELFIQIRNIPLAEEVASGLKLSDPSLLSDPLPIGFMNSSGFEILSPADELELLPDDNLQEKLQ